jgi:hypothetical protein
MVFCGLKEIFECLQIFIWDSRLICAGPQIVLRANSPLPVCQVQVSADGHVMIGGSQVGQVGTSSTTEVIHSLDIYASVSFK